MVAQAQTPDLGTLAKNKGTSIKYVAIGSSLSAGVRDGGVYAAAQQTSFPALLAQQMGITDITRCKFVNTQILRINLTFNL